MSSIKSKMYKNPERNNKEEPYKPYVPQYKQMGIEPVQHKTSLPQGYTSPQYVGSEVNPRDPKPPVRVQPYAEVAISPIGRGKIPNVGNNIEQAWLDYGSEIIDDLSEDIDLNHKMIDNNDLVDINDERSVSDRNILIDQTNMITNLVEGEYCIIVRGNPYCSGNLEFIQEQTRELVFGDQDPISVDDIVVIKRVGIKVGVFVDSM